MDNTYNINILINQFEERIATVFINIARFDVLPRIVYDTQGRFVYANENFTDLLGYSLSDIAGRSIADFMVSEDQERSMSTLNEDGLVVLDNYYNRYWHKDGHIVYLHWLRCYNDKPMQIGSGQCTEISEEEYFTKTQNI